MAGERIVFLGNCQAKALASVYKDHLAPDREQIVHHVAAMRQLEPNGRQWLEAADIVVVQQFGFPTVVTAESIRAGTTTCNFPMATASWLWPFGGQAHPRNEKFPYLVCGPYHAEMGDRFLNRMILHGVGETEALERYLTMDIAHETNLNRLADISLRQQRSRDKRTDIDIASALEANLQCPQLFLTVNHYGLRIFRVVALAVYEKLGIGRSEIETVLARLRRPPFPREANPVHPAVAAHFGIQDAGENERYETYSEGSFTFAEHVHRYMRYEWNAELYEGIFLCNNAAPLSALEKLERGLAISPQSTHGLLMKAGLLARLNRYDEAKAAMADAVALAPDDPEQHAALANILSSNGEVAAAEAAARRAIAFGAEEVAAHRALANVLFRSGRLAEAIDAVRQAIRVLPSAAGSYVWLGQYLSRAGDLSGAASAMRQAVKLGGAWTDTLPRLAEVLAKQGRYNDAMDELRAGLARAPESAELHFALGQLLAGQGEIVGAEASFRTALALRPNHAPTYRELGALSMRRNDLAEAEACYREAIKLTPATPAVYRQLVDVLVKSGRSKEALSIVESALAVQSQNLDLYTIGADILERDGDLATAGDFLHRALQLKPAAATIRRRLAQLLVRLDRINDARVILQAGVAFSADDFETRAALGRLSMREHAFAEAEAHFRELVDACPDRATFQFELANALRLQGMIDEAIIHLKVALTLDPLKAQVHFILGQLLARQGNAAGAAKCYERALQLDAGNEVFKVALGATQERLLHDGILG